MDNLEFANVELGDTYWLEKEFDKYEVKKAVFDLGYNKINGLDGI